MPLPPPPALGSLSFAEIERLAASDAPPPVERWHPPHCGDSAIRIARDGRWYHEGKSIERPALVRLFSRILRREEDGGYVLVTPHEKLDIAVEDAPFVAVEARFEGGGDTQQVAFRLNTDDLVVADAAHPIRIVDAVDGPRPYLTVRAGLEALIARPVYYQLAELAEPHGGRVGVWSGGTFFALEPAE